MRLGFQADAAGFEAGEFALICQLSCGRRYLTFQRDPEGAAEDWGVYLEYDDPANGGYGCVAACWLSKDLLSVDLGRQLGRLASVEGLDLPLYLGPEAFATLHEGLQRVFWGEAHLLHRGYRPLA